MSDRFFYPFIVLLVSAIIAAALFAGGPLKSPGKTPEQISAEGFTAAGEVTVRAKAGGDNPSDRFLLQYFTASVGDSEEQIFALTGQYQDYTITYKTNPPAGEPGSDYVGMWPDIDGQNRTMDVERISVKVIE